MPVDNNELLQALRIERGDREGSVTPRSRWIAGGILATVVLLGGLAAVFLLRGEQFEVQAATAVAASNSGGATAVLQATGYVTARRQATVSAQITGTLTQVLIEEGERVEAGQVLARLENKAQNAALSQARAQYQTARALLEQYNAQLAQARRDLARSENLVARNLVSQQALETARTQMESLQAQTRSQEQQVTLSRAGVDAAQVQLDYTTVRAPFAGVIVAKAAQAGEIISPISAGGGFTRTGVGTIVDMDSLEIEVDVNEQYINRVQSGQPAEAVLNAYPQWSIPASIIAIVPTADRSKATVKVRVAILEKDPRILPDMGVRVSFLQEAPAAATQAPPAGVLVPATALVQLDGRTVVFVIEADRVRARPVTAGQALGDLRRVEGIASGTRIVRSPSAEMVDGARIKVTS